ncbi:transcriptional regulator [Tumebacillus algifaecis]|uniref:Transcriptional regulator n=1 Tax=Tumebacillus algifaecis TaxID=1214604 RepID=A0A223CYI3_9BACL|nr:methyltransferase domain-containing protein [Tumebacillus algifaecis]ASS74167.1 transcriptional regulator [Tumebacillus algifaecis]
MRTVQIKEIADKLQVSTRTIRWYEEKGLITPQKDENNGYRSFSEHEAWRLQTIISLREVGMGIPEIKKVLDQMDAGDEQDVLYYLELQRAVMFSQWIELKGMIETLDRMIGTAKKKQELVWEDIHQLVDSAKGFRDLRKTWKDRWGFDRQAAQYDEAVLREPEFNPHQNYNEALDLTCQLVSPRQGERGLDIGTGTGNLAGRFLAQGIEIAGIDQSREMLRQCQAKYPQMETKLGNFLAIPYLDDQFDFVVTSYALHHLTDEQKLLAFEEMRRVLKPHGRICITDLMFENKAKRAEVQAAFYAAGREDLWAQIEDEYYADRSLLLKWFEDNGYLAQAKQVNDFLHILYAVPIR